MASDDEGKAGENGLVETKTSELFKMKRPGIAGSRHKAAAMLAQTDPQTVATRICIVGDDSGSMSGEPMENVKKGVNNFLAACNPLDTSVSIYLLNQGEKALTCQYDLINFWIAPFHATGGTPLYQRTIQALDQDITRAIIFSDGEPTDGSFYQVGETVSNGNHEKTIQKAVEKHIPLDTVFIKPPYMSDSKAQECRGVLKDLADKTGGIFLEFSSTLTFSQQLKYLSPKLRGILMNAELKEKVERGESI